MAHEDDLGGALWQPERPCSARPAEGARLSVALAVIRRLESRATFSERSF